MQLLVVQVIYSEVSRQLLSGIPLYASYNCSRVFSKSSSRFFSGILEISLGVSVLELFLKAQLENNQEFMQSFHQRSVQKINPCFFVFNFSRDSSGKFFIDSTSNFSKVFCKNVSRYPLSFLAELLPGIPKGIL